MEWRVRVPQFGIDVTCRAAFSNQELASAKGGNNYWEGAVVYSG